VSRLPGFTINGLSNEHRHGIAVEDLFLRMKDEGGRMNVSMKPLAVTQKANLNSEL
jgi:hypothetical protein